jgi:hypothetical protein
MDHEHEKREEKISADPIEQLEEVCPQCSGRCRYNRAPCGLCNASGFVPTEFGSQVLSLIRHNLKPMLEEVSKKSKSILEGATTVFEWVNYIFGNSQLGIKLSSIKTFISSVIKTFDDWLASKVIQTGVNPNVAQKVGSATRWAGVPFVVHSAFGNKEVPTNSTFVIQDYEVKPGSYSKSFE